MDFKGSSPYIDTEEEVEEQLNNDLSNFLIDPCDMTDLSDTTGNLNNLMKS